MRKDTLPTAAAKVIKPDGTKGISLKEKMRKKACLFSAFISRFNAGYLCRLFWAIFLKPFLYNKNAMPAPIASPRNEIIVPLIKPKKRMLAAVINTLGTRPRTAMSILIQILIITASWGYSLKR